MQTQHLVCQSSDPALAVVKTTVRFRYILCPDAIRWQSRDLPEFLLESRLLSRSARLLRPNLPGITSGGHPEPVLSHDFP
jgi:hypothetical protein